MAELSNQLLVVTILGYLGAMLCYAAEYAFGVRGAVARVAARELVPAGAPGPGVAGSGVAGGDPFGGDPASGDRASGDRASGDPGSGDPDGDPFSDPGLAGSPEQPGESGLAERFGTAAVAVTCVTGLVHAGTLVTRAVAAGRVPWGNMYEFLLALTLAGVVAWLVVLRLRPPIRPLGLVVAAVLVLLLGSAGMVYTEAGPLVPALNSAWLRIHVSLVATAGGILLVGFGAAVLYLLRAGHEDGRTGFPYALAAHAPAAASVERLTFRVHAFAFPLLTVGIMCGAIWAESAWGRYWGWDPKEVWSLVTWLTYAAYLHARATPSVPRRTATWLAIAGWAVLLFNTYGVNLVFAGLHSYAGVD